MELDRPYRSYGTFPSFLPRFLGCASFSSLLRFSLLFIFLSFPPQVLLLFLFPFLTPYLLAFLPLLVSSGLRPLLPFSLLPWPHLLSSTSIELPFLVFLASNTFNTFSSLLPLSPSHPSGFQPPPHPGQPFIGAMWNSLMCVCVSVWLKVLTCVRTLQRV